MLYISNDLIAVTCDARGRGLALIDQLRGTAWMLDQISLVYGMSADLTRRESLEPILAEKQNHETLDITFRAGSGQLSLTLCLHHDYVELQISPSSSSDIKFFAMPGSFVSVEGNLKLLLPIMQGMLWDGRGPSFDAIRGEASHTGFAMPFIGYMVDTGGLLVVTETRDDSRWWFGKDRSGRFWATNIQLDSLGKIRYTRKARIYPTDASITGIAKSYRHYVQTMGRFISWEEKLAQRPNLERLFGSLMCFIGYCQDADLDYVAALRKLKKYGFDRALVYPVRFNSYDSDIVMGGQPAIDLSSDQVQAIKRMDYDIAPWSWLNERLDNQTEQARHMFRRDAHGEIKENWAIDDQQWYQICYSFIAQHQHQALENYVADMTWDHFDVLACVPPAECYALDHERHLGRAMSRSEARDWVRKTFELDKSRGWPVSSECFNDAYACEYDIGSVKAWPQYGPWTFWPIPLTMLVYHDSLIHSWWEVHNYNSPWFGRTRAGEFFEYGGGRPRLMAALDALMGCPPDVFPFGAQYGWTGKGKETFLFRYRFHDPEVQLALREALPVARLHRRIGKLEMVDFEILSEDGYVQASTFADGTRVIANFSRDIYGETRGIGHVVLEGVGAVMPESWKILERGG